MKFEKLCQLVFEAKDEKPGQRYFSAKNAAGPAGIVSGPIGKADNFELRQPVSRWDFDPNQPVNNEGLRAQKNVWKTLSNAFALLMNDDNFLPSVNSIEKEFSKHREGLRHTLGVDAIGDDGKVIQYDEESKLETLPRAIINYNGKIEAELELSKKLARQLKYTNLNRNDVINLEADVGNTKNSLKAVNKKINEIEPSTRKQALKLQDQLLTSENILRDLNAKAISIKDNANIKVKIAKEKANKLEYATELNSPKYSRILNLLNIRDKVLTKLGIREDKLNASQMSPDGVAALEASYEKSQGKIQDYTEKRDIAQGELDNITDRLEESRKELEKANNVAMSQFINQVLLSADKIKNRIANDLGVDPNVSQEDLNYVDWEAVPSKLLQKLQMAQAIASSDYTVNPVLGYIEAFNRRYYAIPADYTTPLYDPNTKQMSTYVPSADNEGMFRAKELDSREFNREINITKNRDFNSLPAVRLMSILSEVGHAKMPINRSHADVDVNVFKPAYDAFVDYVNNFSNTDDAEINAKYANLWNDLKIKRSIYKLVTDMGLGPQVNDTAKRMLRMPWNINRYKYNSFQQLLSTISSESKVARQNLNMESFDDFFASLIKEKTFNEDDFKIGVMEILGRK